MARAGLSASEGSGEVWPSFYDLMDRVTSRPEQATSGPTWQPENGIAGDGSQIAGNPAFDLIAKVNGTYMDLQVLDSATPGATPITNGEDFSVSMVRTAAVPAVWNGYAEIMRISGKPQFGWFMGATAGVVFSTAIGYGTGLQWLSIGRIGGFVLGTQDITLDYGTLYAVSWQIDLLALAARMKIWPKAGIEPGWMLEVDIAPTDQPDPPNYMLLDFNSQNYDVPIIPGTWHESSGRLYKVVVTTSDAD